MALFGLHLHGMRNDVLFALRSMRRAPAFAATALLTLILGIGATTAIFSVVNAVLFRSLPYRRASELVHVVADDPGDPRSASRFSVAGITFSVLPEPFNACRG